MMIHGFVPTPLSGIRVGRRRRIKEMADTWFADKKKNVTISSRTYMFVIVSRLTLPYLLLIRRYVVTKNMVPLNIGLN
jgi:hypothetical protein